MILTVIASALWATTIVAVPIVRQYCKNIRWIPSHLEQQVSDVMSELAQDSDREVGAYLEEEHRVDGNLEHPDAVEQITANRGGRKPDCRWLKRVRRGKDRNGVEYSTLFRARVVEAARAVHPYAKENDANRIIVHEWMAKYMKGLDVREKDQSLHLRICVSLFFIPTQSDIEAEQLRNSAVAWSSRDRSRSFFWSVPRLQLAANLASQYDFAKAGQAAWSREPVARA